MAVEDSVAQDQLRAFIERIERMEEEKAAIAADIKEIYAEAKGNGFDTKILRKIVTIRKQDANERMEQEALLELYMDALGMQQAHDAAVTERFQRGVGGRSAPLAADRIESISEPITEQQVAPHPASDLTVSPKLPQGQVAPHSEPAREGGSQSQEAAGTGRDAAAPSSGEAQPKYAAPGEVTFETHPPEGVERGSVSMAFGNMGQDPKAIQHDLEKGTAQPIVKQGKVILDGWARFMTARNMVELDGQPMAYPVVQYSGSDPLIDAIRWNVEGRTLDDHQKKLIAANLTRQNPARKDDIYRAFEIFLEPV